MKVKDIIKKLETLDGELDVFVPCNDGEFEYYIVNSVHLTDINYYDEEEKEVVVIHHE